MTELHLSGLEKRFGDVFAVRDVELTIKPGSLVALLGPSGCGKTTTLRMVAGLEEPTAGDIRFDGESVLGIPPEKRQIGMVFQRYVLFPHMTVERNISFGLRMRGMDEAEIRRRVDEILDVVQLKGLANRFPSQLSGGQQQRVAIARTVVTDPRLLLMDEPLSNLDARLRDEMRTFITSLQRRLGITTLFVTHDQLEAIELADTIGVMFDGNLIQLGSPEEVFNRPCNLRIADFMGTTNVLEGTLRTVNADGSVLETRVGSLRVAAGSHHRDGARVTATVRPEHIDLLPLNGKLGPNQFSGRIREVVYFGGTFTYRVDANGVSLEVRDRSTRRLAPDEEVVVSISHDHLWVFPG